MPKNIVQASDGGRHEIRRQVLIPGGHAQIFVAELGGYGVNVGAAHSHPAGGGVPQIMERKIDDAKTLTRCDESFADVVRGAVLREHLVHRLRAHPPLSTQAIARKPVQMDDSTLTVLRLGEQDATAVQVHVEPAQPKNLAPAHPCEGCEAGNGTQPVGAFL